MITKANALQIGKAIVQAATAEKDNCFNRIDEVYAINGAVHRMLQNLWYDVLPERTTEVFGWDCQKFIDEVWK